MVERLIVTGAAWRGANVDVYYDASAFPTCGAFVGSAGRGSAKRGPRGGFAGARIGLRSPLQGAQRLDKCSSGIRAVSHVRAHYYHVPRVDMIINEYLHRTPAAHDVGVDVLQRRAPARADAVADGRGDCCAAQPLPPRCRLPAGHRIVGHTLRRTWTGGPGGRTPPHLAVWTTREHDRFRSAAGRVDWSVTVMAGTARRTVAPPML